MVDLKKYADVIIDWNLTPEHAVTMYLEWGNNDWNAEYPPVRSKEDISTYFVVDTWGKTPIVRLVQRNSEQAVDLISFPLDEKLIPEFKREHGKIKGIFAPTEPIKHWLRQEMGC